MGRISQNFVKAFQHELGAINRAAGEFTDGLPFDLANLEELAQELSDPQHVLYVAAQQFASAFAEGVSEQPEFAGYSAIVGKAEDEYLPEGPPVFDADDITDRSERFMASEILREKLFRNLGEELPYGIAVEIEKFEQEGDLRRIHAAVIVDRAGHRAIVIGKGGERMKRISTDARKEMETLFGGKVWLETWVKVKGGWADDERALKSLGYD